MPKFKNARFKELLKSLSQDPKLRLAIDKLNAKSAIGLHVRSLKEFLPFVAKLSKFGGKKTLVFAEHISLIIFLFELSVLVKTNVFDRPEVRKFFSENWGALEKKVAAMYIFCSNQVRDQLAKAKEAASQARARARTSRKKT